MVHESKLPSGGTILNLWGSSEPSQTETRKESNESMEATAGAMALDVEGQCPKCGTQMGLASADGEQVFYCDPCRVSLPLPIND